MKAVIVSNPYRDKNLHCAAEGRRILEASGIEAPVCLPFDVDKDFVLPATMKLSDLEAELDQSDLMICFGGDGTLLHASKVATFHKIPVLGVNIGTMGFMTELEATELAQLSELSKRQYHLEDRMMISVSVLRDGQVVFTEEGLNDAAITKGAIARVIQMDVFCEGIEVMSFSGDGVILSTPTGSTAYSMSAGGPIIEPTAENIIITSICAHTMQCRPIVTAPSRTIDTRIGRVGRKNAFLSVDGGKVFRLNSGDIIRVRKSQHVTKLVRLTNKSFFEVLNKKLK